MNDATVYIVNRSAHDFSDAEKYGTIRYLTEGNIYPFNVAKMVRIVEEEFQNARPQDYILLTSLTVLCCITCSIFAKRFGRLNLLLFKDGKYVERKIKLD